MVLLPSAGGKVGFPPLIYC